MSLCFGNPARRIPRGCFRPESRARFTCSNCRTIARTHSPARLRNSGRLVRGVPPLVDRFAGFAQQIAAFVRGPTLPGGSDRALLVRALLGTSGARKRTGRCSICTTSNRCCTSDAPARKAGPRLWRTRYFAGRRAISRRRWLPRYDCLLTASGGRRATRSRDFAAVPDHGLSECDSLRAAARRRRTGNDRILRKPRIPSERLGGPLFPQRDLADFARPVAVSGLAADRQESAGGAEIIQVAMRVSRCPGPVENAIEELAAAKSGGGSAARGKRDAASK